MSKFRLVAPFMIVMLVLTACPAGDGGGGDSSPGGGGGGTDGSGGAEGGSIIVTSLWGGAEEEAFQAVLDAFEAETGITAEYEANRTDYPTVLQTRIQGGNPPDVAIIPGIGTLRNLARDGSLIPLSDLGIERDAIEGNYAPGIVDVGVVDDELYAVMVKFNSKSTIWYDPTRFEALGVEPPTDFEGLVQVTEDIKAAGSTPWALGAGPDSEWTLTDWFESIYLRQAGTESYDTLFSADGDWTDSSVMDAIASMQEILNDENVEGGIEASLSIGFVDGIAKVFSTSPSAELYYEGGFVGGIAASDDVNPDLEIGTDIDFFDFPTVDGGGEGSVTIGGDVMAALTDNPGVAEFMEYLTTAEAGQVWAEQGTIISPILAVDSSVYEGVSSTVVKEAEQVTGADAVRFDGSDLLPAGPNLGFVLQAVLSGEDAGAELEEFQAAVSTAWEEEGS